MKEDFLQYVWKFGLFTKTTLKTTSNKNISLVKLGMHNLNSGPDFLNAQLKIDDQLWAGNVEIHVHSSDWYLHNHEADPNYETVILHVVWEHDADVFMKNNQPIPTLILKDLVDKKLLKNYANLFSKKTRWIPCESTINTVDSFTLIHWKERLFFERLSTKSVLIGQLLKDLNNDYEAVLFQLLFKNFGLKINGEAFFRLGKIIDFSAFKKVRFNEEKLAALFFGQAGFLEDEIEDVYFLSLKKEYEYLKHTFNLASIAKNEFSFFRMRPPNFPTVRIAQLVSLFFNNQHFFSKIMALNSLKEYYELFSITMPDFWKTRFTFETPSKKGQKKLTKSFVDLIVINTIIPLKFMYQKSKGAETHQNILDLIKDLKPEKNSIISKFNDLKITTDNAFETQALLELKNKYCDEKRCLACAIGNNILKKT